MQKLCLFSCTFLFSLVVGIVVNAQQANSQTAKRVLRTAAPRKLVKTAKTPYFHYANVGLVSWSEDNKLTLSGEAVSARLNVQGVHLGYALFTKALSQSWMIEPFGEILSANIADTASTLDFRQKNIPVYAAGLNLSWLFLTRSTGTTMGLTTRAAYRLVDLKKTAADDIYDKRTAVLISEELSFGWALSRSFSFTHSIGFGLNSPGMTWQAGLRWRFL